MSEKPMSRYQRENAQAEILRDIRSKITEAQSRNDSKSANRHYQQERKILARLFGDEVGVGGRGPTRQKTV